MRWQGLVCVFALAGCDDTFRQTGPGNGLGGNDDSGAVIEGSGRSCDRRVAQGICEAYVGEGWDDASIRADCSGADDVLLAASCPPSDIGGCDETLGNPEGTIVWYYVGEFYTASSAGSLEAECTTDYYDWLPR